MVGNGKFEPLTLRSPLSPIRGSCHKKAPSWIISTYCDATWSGCTFTKLSQFLYLTLSSIIMKANREENNAVYLKYCSSTWIMSNHFLLLWKNWLLKSYFGNYSNLFWVPRVWCFFDKELILLFYPDLGNLTTQIAILTSNKI